MTHIYQRTRNLMKALDEYQVNPSLGAEVGVKLGKNASGLLLSIPKLHLILIDNYQEDQKKSDGAPIQQTGFSKLKDAAVLRLSPYSDRITWLLKSSLDAADDIEDGSLDFVFIDAEHTYEAVKQDIELYLPKVRVGGVLSGHDFAPGYSGLRRAVRERFPVFKRNLDVWFLQVTDSIQRRLQ